MTSLLVPDKGPLDSIETFDDTLYSLPRAPIRMAMIEASVGLTVKLSCSMYQLISSSTWLPLASMMDALICNSGTATSVLPCGVPANGEASVRAGIAHNAASKQMLVNNEMFRIGVFLS